MAPIDSRPSTAISSLHDALVRLSQMYVNDNDKRDILQRLARRVEKLPRNADTMVRLHDILVKFIDDVEAANEKRLLSHAVDKVSEDFENDDCPAIVEFIQRLKEFDEEDDPLANILEIVRGWLKILSREQRKLDAQKSGNDHDDTENPQDVGDQESRRISERRSLIQDTVENVAMSLESTPNAEEFRRQIKSIDGEEGLQMAMSLIVRHLNERFHSQNADGIIDKPNGTQNQKSAPAAGGTFLGHQDETPATQERKTGSQLQPSHNGDHNMSDHHTPDGPRHGSPGLPDQYIHTGGHTVLAGPWFLTNFCNDHGYERLVLSSVNCNSHRKRRRSAGDDDNDGPASKSRKPTTTCHGGNLQKHDPQNIQISQSTGQRLNGGPVDLLDDSAQDRRPDQADQTPPTATGEADAASASQDQSNTAGSGMNRTSASNKPVMKPPPRPPHNTGTTSKPPPAKSTNNNTVSTPAVPGPAKPGPQTTPADNGGSQGVGPPQFKGWTHIENPGAGDPKQPRKKPGAGEKYVLYMKDSTGKKEWSLVRDETFKTEEDRMHDEERRGEQEAARKNEPVGLRRSHRAQSMVPPAGTPALGRSASVVSTGPQTRGGRKAGSQGATTPQPSTIDGGEEEEEEFDDDFELRTASFKREKKGKARVQAEGGKVNQKIKTDGKANSGTAGPVGKQKGKGNKSSKKGGDEDEFIADDADEHDEISNLTHLETQPSPKQRSLSEQSSEGDPSAMHRSRHKHARVFLRPKESERRRKGRALRKRLLGEGFEAWRSQMEQNSDAKAGTGKPGKQASRVENQDEENLYRLTPEAEMPDAFEVPEEEDGEAGSDKSVEDNGDEDDDFEVDGEDFGTAEMDRLSKEEDGQDEEEEQEEDV